MNKIKQKLMKLYGCDNPQKNLSNKKKYKGVKLKKELMESLYLI